MWFDRDKWQEIFGTMRKHKLRTFLTALGVFWGIFMLVFLLGMGAGLRNGAFRNFSKKTKNIMYVWASTTSKPYKGFQPGRRPQLRLDDIRALKASISELNYIAPRHSINAPVYYQGTGSIREIRGELTDMIKIEALKLYQGRYINKVDLDEARKVVVIGERVREILFEDEPPIGKYIRVKGVEFKVVGVFGPIEIKPWTESDLESVVIPLTTMDQAFGSKDEVDYFVCSADEGIPMSLVEPKVRGLLRERHNVAPDDPRGIGGFNLEEEFNKVQTLFVGINAFLWFVGIGTLLAGIVGVSNIMMIIVKERTKEIGIRKAMGATPGSIISLILTESVFITSFSGYLGLFAATGLIWIINTIMVVNEVETENFYNPEVNLTVGLGSIILLIVAGAIAGLIPALRAAAVNPVIALRDE